MRTLLLIAILSLTACSTFKVSAEDTFIEGTGIQCVLQIDLE